MQIWKRVELGCGWTGLNLHLVIFEDGGAEFLLDVADAVWRCMSRHVRGDGKSWVEYKRAGFAGWLLARYSVMESCVFIAYGIRVVAPCFVKSGEDERMRGSEVGRN